MQQNRGLARRFAGSAEHSPIAGAPVLHQNYLEAGFVPEACQRGLVTQAAAWFEIPSWWTKV
jgi:hypothetical protein